MIIYRLIRVASTIAAPDWTVLLTTLFDHKVYFSKVVKQLKLLHFLKSGNTQNFTTYRPIFILTRFDKIFEKLIVSF